MTDDEDFICRTWNRDLFVAWKHGEITFDEAAFLARRVDFHEAIEWMPAWMLRIALKIYDFLYEPSVDVRKDERRRASPTTKTTRAVGILISIKRQDLRISQLTRFGVERHLTIHPTACTVRSPCRVSIIHPRHLSRG